MKTTQHIYSVNKEVSKILHLDDDFNATKRIILRKEEANYLLKKGIAIYKETRKFPDGSIRTIYFCEVTLDELVSFAKR
jgi:hypothetical protein